MRAGWCISILAATALAACSKGGGSTEGEQAAKVVPSSEPSAAAPTAEAVRMNKKLEAPVREGSTIVRALTDDALYVADEDHGAVRKLELPLDLHPTSIEIPMPGQPAQMVALADRVLVTIRNEGAVAPGMGEKKEGASDKPRVPAPPTGAGLLLIMKPDAQKGLVEAARVPLPQDAWGIAVTPDAATAIVTSAWTHKVSAVDLASAKVRWTVDVPREPRAAVVHPSGTSVYVTHLVGADLTRIDGIGGEAPTVKRVAFPAAPLRAPVGKTNSASLAYSATLSPDGKRLFVARHALGAMGPQVWLGASAVDVLLTGNDSPLAPMRTDAPRAMADTPEGKASIEDPSVGGRAPRINPVPFVQPRAMVYHKKSQTLLVASEGGDAVAKLLASPIDPTMFPVETYDVDPRKGEKLRVAAECGAPSGIALSADEDTAWVYCRSTFAIATLSLTDRRLPREGGGNRLPLDIRRLAEDPLPEQAALGRRLYYNGIDEPTSGGMGCAGCHPDGRDDGHVWHEAGGVANEGTNFFSGEENIPGFWNENPPDAGFARQTPLLAGRLVAEGPYGWHAESSNITDRLKNGFRLHRWGDMPDGHQAKDIYDRAMAIRAFVRAGLVPPPREARELSPEEKRGKELFMSEETKCSGCHVPNMDYSDREKYPVLPKEPRKGFSQDLELAYKTPSLLSVGGTAPYMHDGRFSTLEELVDRNDDRMGRTNQLNKADRAALVAFLRTL
ncbi:c-type cytochrome [Polyangium aurulentum]|uniref:c-type cytochrome n=1 Tax=Polyangium aurulentum TaxID=2567896 RepID=UPI0010AE6112|nr:c-type cytochrome [Polyangium aurulentum]UQA62880.1 hypothetical protein E8A73_021470 [Polyangium aurulentum]